MISSHILDENESDKEREGYLYIDMDDMDDKEKISWHFTTKIEENMSKSNYLYLTWAMTVNREMYVLYSNYSRFKEWVDLDKGTWIVKKNDNDDNQFELYTYKEIKKVKNKYYLNRICKDKKECINEKSGSNFDHLRKIEGVKENEYVQNPLKCIPHPKKNHHYYITNSPSSSSFPDGSTLYLKGSKEYKSPSEYKGTYFPIFELK